MERNAISPTFTSRQFEACFGHRPLSASLQTPADCWFYLVNSVETSPVSALTLQRTQPLAVGRFRLLRCKSLSSLGHRVSVRRVPGRDLWRPYWRQTTLARPAMQTKRRTSQKISQAQMPDAETLAALRKSTTDARRGTGRGKKRQRDEEESEARSSSSGKGRKRVRLSARS